MGLLETAAADLAAILADVDGGFSVPIEVTDPRNNTATVNGLATDIGLTIDPETGVAVAGRKASIALSLRALAAAGLGEPRGIPDGNIRPWTARFQLRNGASQLFKIKTVMPDKLGSLVCFLETYSQ